MEEPTTTPQPATSFNDKYRIHSLLGEGGNGRVYKCHERATLRPFAVKTVAQLGTRKMMWDDEEQRELPTEVAFWKNLRHRNIVRLVEHFCEGGTWYYVMEHCEGYVDLFQHINDLTEAGRYLPERDVKHILRQVLEALSYLRTKDIDHRDLKDENLLIHPRNKLIKMIDFGSATRISESPYRTMRGTDIYIPPEWYNDHQYEWESGTVWAIGCLAYILMNGESPFNSVPEVIKGVIPSYKNEDVTLLAQKFVRRCLRMDVMSREKFHLLKRSPWLRKPRGVL